MKKIAVVSVTDKKTIVKDVKDLIEAVGRQGDELVVYSTGGTARCLREGGLEIHDLQELVGGKELFGDLVKSLSREVAAGLLARPEHRVELAANGMVEIDFAFVDFYALEKAIREFGDDRSKVIAATDVGGPTMAHEAAKGRRVIASRPQERRMVIDWLIAGKPNEDEFLTGLAARADWTAGTYITESGIYHGHGQFAATFLEKVRELLYGENPHQKPAIQYVQTNTVEQNPLAIHLLEKIEGTEASFNNLNDLSHEVETITRIAAGFDVSLGTVPYIAVVDKHGNPCDAAYGADPLEAIRRAVEGDTLAAFGGEVLTNFSITRSVADVLLHHAMPTDDNQRYDCIAAPGFDDDAIALLRRKNDKCRFLVNPAFAKLDRNSISREPELRQIIGGALGQPASAFVLDINDPDIFVMGDLTPQQMADIVLSWAVGSTGVSNTVVLAKNGRIISSAFGQQARVYAVRIAILKAQWAGHDPAGSVFYSDSFFPFEDAPDELGKAGIVAGFTSRAGIHWEDVVAKFKSYNMAICALPDAKCRGFRH